MKISIYWGLEVIKLSLKILMTKVLHIPCEKNFINGLSHFTFTVDTHKNWKVIGNIAMNNAAN